MTSIKEALRRKGYDSMRDSGLFCF